MHMNVSISVENIKCGGCASSIKKKLLEDERISAVDVDVEKGVVEIKASELAVDDWTAALLKMGYPESGTAEGMAAAKARAKSFVSCAVGRIDNAMNK